MSNNLTITENEPEMQRSFENATGPIRYGMTNDYMFRVVLQSCKPALKGLICSILQLKEDEVIDVLILNPINPGEGISDKETRMDVRVLLNNNTTLDLEMQVKNYGDWPERSITYLCREFDTLSVGENYDQVKSVYQIGFLDFTLFENHPEFCGRYQLRNKKDGYLYSSKLNIIVVELNHTELATEEDVAHGIDEWAKFFKAKTWEDLKMIAQDKEAMKSAAESIFLSNEDYNIRKVCIEREEHERFIERLQNEVEAKDAIIAEKDVTIAEKDATIADKDNTIAKLQAELDRIKLTREKIN